MIKMISSIGICLAIGLAQVSAIPNGVWPEARPARPPPEAIPTPTPSSTSTNATSSGGMNPLLASALADYLAKQGGSQAAEGGTDSISNMLLGKARPEGFRGFAPAAAPMALGMPFMPIPRPPKDATLASIYQITGKGPATAYQCWESHIEYNHASYTYIKSFKTTVYSTKTVTGSTMQTISNNPQAKTTTLCDNIPRVLEPTAVPVTLTFASETMLEVSQITPGPTPTCKIPDTECNHAWDAFQTATFSYQSSALFSYFLDSHAKKTAPNIWFDPLRPPCTSVKLCPEATASPSCFLQADQATLFYWPSTHKLKAYCTKPNPFATSSQAPAVPTDEPEDPEPYPPLEPRPFLAFRNTDPPIEGPTRTAVHGTLTVTSPSPLLIVRSIVASQHSRITVSPAPQYIPQTQCGAHLTAATLILDAKSLSTMRPSFSQTYLDPGKFTGFSSTQTPVPINYADLGPASALYDAYAAAPEWQCDPEHNVNVRCPKTIYVSSYTPVLALPTNIAQPWAKVQQELVAGTSDEEALGEKNAQALNCKAGSVGQVRYVPIHGTRIEMPSVTRYGAMVTVGPIEGKEEAERIERVLSNDWADDMRIEVVPGDNLEL